MNNIRPQRTTSPWPRWTLALALAPTTACVADGHDDLLEPALVPDDDFRLDAPLEYGEPQTMLIRYRNDPGQRGSATLIAPNVVVTNAHASFGGGPAPVMYLQRGTHTAPGIDELQVAEKVHHPNYTNPGDTNDIALLRLGCNITDIPPATINRSELVNGDIGSSIKAVGYGPTGWGLTDWGIKRSMGDALTSFNHSWLSVSGVSAYAGDSGGSLYGFPSGAVGPGGDDGADFSEPGGDDEGAEGGGEPEGAGDSIYPQRKLIGIITWASGTSLRVDRHSAWIDGVVASWVDPTLPEQPAARSFYESNPPKVCPNHGVAGHYSIVSPEPGVTYTWAADGATVTSPGTSATVTTSSTAPFTLTVTAGGYCTASGARGDVLVLDAAHPDVAHDLANPDTPHGLYGVLSVA
ncbi:MAG: trypsin-like serine protease, partial [Deltaproteobacteria bacterium]|nr:trypsin-like serine protease [Deltaproteobacteria bacterium]